MSSGAVSLLGVAHVSCIDDTKQNKTLFLCSIRATQHILGISMKAPWHEERGHSKPDTQMQTRKAGSRCHASPRAAKFIAAHGLDYPKALPPVRGRGGGREEGREEGRTGGRERDKVWGGGWAHQSADIVAL